jgi:Family of unknown function (DUF6504)
MRTYADPVEVRTGTGEDTDIPAAFLWRGRLYVVRDVLGHWRERRSWWSSPAARLVHGMGGMGDDDGEDQAAGAGVRVVDLAEEREVWRVCASRGRSYTEGVFDLCRQPGGHDPTLGAAPSATSSSVDVDVWCLVHVAD